MLEFYRRERTLEGMLKLASSPKSICEVEEFVQQLTQKYNISPERYPDILISLTEAVNNAIIHGNNSNVYKKVVIEHSYGADGLTFSVTDEGEGFKPETIPDPTCKENLRNVGGRGVFLMRTLSDKVKFANNGSMVIICFEI